jgi:hypothetical protein
LDEPELAKVVESDLQSLVELAVVVESVDEPVVPEVVAMASCSERRSGKIRDANSGVGSDRVVPVASALQCVPAEPNIQLVRWLAIARHLD